MCDYCMKMKSIYWNTDGVIREVYIERDGSLSVSVNSNPEDDDNRISTKINYCPMCGEKLH